MMKISSNLSSEEIIEFIQQMGTEIKAHNDNIVMKTESDAARLDSNFNTTTERYGYVAERKLPSKNSSKEYIYINLIVNTGLHQYFSQQEFDMVYEISQQSNKLGEFRFDQHFMHTLELYSIYKIYVKEKQVSISFGDFVDQDIYHQILIEQENERYKKETEEIQKAFTFKTEAQLKELYELDKHYINNMYTRYVTNYGCAEFLSLSEFVKLYDLADRNYRNSLSDINYRIQYELINKYYELFVSSNNLTDIISENDMWSLFREADGNYVDFGAMIAEKAEQKKSFDL